MAAADDALEHVERFRERGDVSLGQRRELSRELGHATLASLLHDARALRRCANADDAPVFRIDLATHESSLLECGDDARHRGRPHLFRRGEVAEGDGAGEDDDGECRESWGAKSGGVVLAAEASEQVDSRGVQPIGRLDGGVGRGRFRALGSCGSGHEAQFISFAN